MSRAIATIDSAGSLSGHGGGYAYVSKDKECCPPVIDPLTLLTVLGAIAAVTVGLRQVVIDNIPIGRKKRAADVFISMLNPLRGRFKYVPKSRKGFARRQSNVNVNHHLFKNRLV